MSHKGKESLMKGVSLESGFVMEGDEGGLESVNGVIGLFLATRGGSQHPRFTNHTTPLDCDGCRSQQATHQTTRFCENK
jgi:hypothetical protein